MEPFDISPDQIIPKTLAQIMGAGSPTSPYNTGNSPILKPIQSTNWKDDTLGWRLNTNGEAEFNGARTVSTNFRPAVKLFGVTIYVSNGTTPNGNLSGNAGDICLKGATGNAYKCTSGTTWVSFT